MSQNLVQMLEQIRSGTATDDIKVAVLENAGSLQTGNLIDVIASLWDDPNEHIKRQVKNTNNLIVSPGKIPIIFFVDLYR